MGTTDLVLKRLERDLRPIARKRIANGKLPGQLSKRFWGGFGIGRPCSLCEERIQSDDFEYEVEPMEVALPTLRFHRVCHYAWQRECDRLKRKPGGMSKKPHN